jgi:hypothetical protein
MTLPAPRELAEMGADELAEKLVTLALACRDAARTGDFVEPLEELEALQEAARFASAENLALLEVAIAMLKALTRSTQTIPELAVQRLLRESEHAEKLLRRLLEAPLERSEIARDERVTRDILDRLAKVGVVRSGSSFDIAPSYRRLVEDLIEPVSFRMWRAVDEARAFIAAADLNNNQGAEYLSAHLGVSQGQAHSHLSRFEVARSGAIQFGSGRAVVRRIHARNAVSGRGKPAQPPPSGVLSDGNFVKITGWRIEFGDIAQALPNNKEDTDTVTTTTQQQQQQQQRASS